MCYRQLEKNEEAFTVPRRKLTFEQECHGNNAKFACTTKKLFSERNLHGVPLHFRCHFTNDTA